jgi:RNA polymerase sigma factor (sigma-70 family)
MDEALLVSRAMAGDLDSFGQLYDRYFSRIYDFAWRITRDADEAADVTQDVFMKAMQALPGLGKASSFKSWLFTIAHNTAVTRAERAGRAVALPEPSHEEAFGSFDIPDPCRLNDPEIVAGDHELAALVWEAASALNPRDYALLDLHVRQGLESAEIATVMGVSKGNAYTMVSRMKTAAADVIGSYVVARRGSSDCDGLQDVLAQFEFPPYTEPVRKAVDAHVKDCDTCQGSRKRLAAPLELLGAFAAVPAPMALKGTIWGNVANAWASTGPGSGTGSSGESNNGSPADGARPTVAGMGGGYGGGFDGAVSPMSAGDNGWDRNRILLFAGAVMGLLIVAFGGGALLTSALGGGGGGGAAKTTRTPTPASAGTSTPRVTLTVGRVNVSTPTPAPSATITKTPEPPTEAPPPNTPVPPTNTPRVPTSTPTPRGRRSPTPVPATPTKQGKATATATP